MEDRAPELKDGLPICHGHVQGPRSKRTPLGATVQCRPSWQVSAGATCRFTGPAGNDRAGRLLSIESIFVDCWPPVYRLDVGEV